MSAWQAVLQAAPPDEFPESLCRRRSALARARGVSAGRGVCLLFKTNSALLGSRPAHLDSGTLFARLGRGTSGKERAPGENRALRLYAQSAVSGDTVGNV